MPENEQEVDNWCASTQPSALNPVPVKAPWHMIGNDFVGPLSPEADDGNSYILTVSDYFTKWVEALPTSDKCASTVAAALFKVLLTYFQHCL